MEQMELGRLLAIHTVGRGNADHAGSAVWGSSHAVHGAVGEHVEHLLRPRLRTDDLRRLRQLRHRTKLRRPMRLKSTSSDLSLFAPLYIFVVRRILFATEYSFAFRYSEMPQEDYDFRPVASLLDEPGAPQGDYDF